MVIHVELLWVWPPFVLARLRVFAEPYYIAYQCHKGDATQYDGGYLAAIQPGVVPSMGFDAIAVSLLGGNNPVGCVLASFLITVISKGSVYMSSRQNIDMEIASLVTAFILTFAACSAFLGRRRK